MLHLPLRGRQELGELQWAAATDQRRLQAVDPRPDPHHGARRRRAAVRQADDSEPSAWHGDAMRLGENRADVIGAEQIEDVRG